MTFPEPVIAVAIEPKTKADEEKLGLSLARLAMEDPTFRVTTETETSQTLIHGMGELHLEIIVDRLLREFKVEANVGKPQVAYRETIRKPRRRRASSCGRRVGAASTGRVSRGGARPGQGFIFENKIIGGSIRRSTSRRREGREGSAGYRRARRLSDRGHQGASHDGSYHDVDSSEIAFKIAGSMAFKEACRRAKPVLLEPVMDVEVVTPRDYVGPVIGNLNSRRGRIMSQEIRGTSEVFGRMFPSVKCSAMPPICGL